MNIFFVMRVKLAGQVFKETVDDVLNNFGPEEAAETGKLCIFEC